MSRWLTRLRDKEKNTETHFDGPDKTDETPRQPVLSVLSVRQSGEYEKKAEAFNSAPPEDCRDFAASDREIQVSQNAASAIDPSEASLAAAGAPFTPKPGPGVTIREPAIEVSASTYDAHLDRLIADMAASGGDVGRLASIKRCGAVIPRGGDWIFTRGRA